MGLAWLLFDFIFWPVINDCAGIDTSGIVVGNAIIAIVVFGIKYRFFK
jgi:hypothetical protein